MALEVSKSITLAGKCIVDGNTIESYTASINEQKPEGMTITRNILNGPLRKEKRTECIADQVAFEEMAYTMQNSMQDKTDE